MDATKEQLKDRIESVLEARFPGCHVFLETPIPAIGEDANSFGGWVVWEGFNELDHIDRQRAMWDVLKKALDPDELKQIRSLLTISSEEYGSWAIEEAGRNPING